MKRQLKGLSLLILSLLLSLFLLSACKAPQVPVVQATAPDDSTQLIALIVIGHEWERSISIQEYRNFSEQSWRDSSPAGDNVSMQLASCHSEIRSYNQVPDGQECRTVRKDNVDGTYSESQECTTKYRREPVYDDMCTWSGQRWEHERDVRASGNLSQNSGPNISLNCEGQRSVGCERESGRDEHYWVLFTNFERDANYKCEFSQTEWQSIPLESLWTGEIRVVSILIGEMRVLVDGGLICDSLQKK